MTDDCVTWIVNLMKIHHAKYTKKELRLHIKNAKRQKVISSKMMRQGICPNCGGQLVLRHGQYGNFYGCSNYPKCKFIQN